MSKKLDKIAETLMDQLGEDRKRIQEAYDELKGLVNSGADYVNNGQTLTKLAEVMIKQTAQLVDVVKILNAGKKEEGKNLLGADVEGIYDKLQKQ